MYRINNQPVGERISKYQVGDKLYFAGEKRPYVIKAANDRFLICTKPFNLKHSVLYTIVDLKQCKRGRNNLVFNIYNYSKQEDIDNCLHALSSGEVEVSHRNFLPLIIMLHSRSQN